VIERLQEAVDGLDSLVDRTVRGDHSDAELREEMLHWEREDAGGSGKLAETAISLLEYQLAEQGISAEDLHGSEEAERSRALQRLKAALMPEPEDMLPREAPLDPAYQERFPQARGFTVGTAQGIMSPEEYGWHISVSHPERYPTWEELQAAASLLEGAPAMWAMVPLQENVGGIASNVVHLFERPPISG
jgi:hypothetical protein